MYLKLGLVNNICANYACGYRTDYGYCGRTAGCIHDKLSSKTYVVNSNGDIVNYIPSKEINIKNDGSNHYLYIGGNLIMKSKSIHDITMKIEQYDKEHKL